MRKAAYVILLFLLVAGAFLAGSRYSRRTVSHATGARNVLYYVDPMHPAYKSDKPGIAPDCGMELVAVYADGGATDVADNTGSSADTVKISPEKQQVIGVRLGRVEKQSGSYKLRLFGRVAPDEARFYRLNAGIDGFIQDVSQPTTGSQVKKDELLATFSAPNATSIIQTYILNVGAEERFTKAVQESSIEGQALPAANWNILQRIQQLQSVGIPLAQIDEIRRTRKIPERIKILAPADGFVLARNVTPGLKFDKGAEFYRIADLSRVWIVADVFGDDAQCLRPGSRAQILLPDQQISLPATVSAILPQFDPATRTLKVRLEADNPGYVLRPDMFVNVDVSVTFPPTITVEADAVLDTGLNKAVLVDRGGGFFERRAVEVGRHFSDRVEIVKGLRHGEQIVVSGNFLIDSESRLKAPSDSSPLAAPAQPVAISAKKTTDLKCGMEVDPTKAATAGNTVTYRGTTYYFCSSGCRDEFRKDPEKYLASSHLKAEL